MVLKNFQKVNIRKKCHLDQHSLIQKNLEVFYQSAMKIKFLILLKAKNNSIKQIDHL